MKRRQFLQALAAGGGLMLLPPGARPAPVQRAPGALRLMWCNLDATQLGSRRFILACTAFSAYRGVPSPEPVAEEPFEEFLEEFLGAPEGEGIQCR